jgi:hypothetical protein
MIRQPVGDLEMLHTTKLPAGRSNIMMNSFIFHTQADPRLLHYRLAPLLTCINIIYRLSTTSILFGQRCINIICFHSKNNILYSIIIIIIACLLKRILFESLYIYYLVLVLERMLCSTVSMQNESTMCGLLVV